MLGRAFIPNTQWEHFPLIKSTDLDGILVDASISVRGSHKISLTSFDFNASVLTVQVLVDDTTVTLSETLSTFGDYLTFTSNDVSTSLQITLILHDLPASFSWSDIAGVEFSQATVTLLDNVVFSLDEGTAPVSGDVTINATAGIKAEVSGNTILLSLDELDCPDPCPTIDNVVRSINGNFRSINHLGFTSKSYTVYSDTQNTVTLRNYVESCCDCEDQAPIWNAFVDEVSRYNSLIDQLDALKEQYNSLIDRLDFLSTSPCDEWAKIRDMYFSRALFCKIILDPLIEEQPEPSEVLEDNTAEFTVVATGTGTLTYQWQFYNLNTWSWEDLPGEVSDTLVIPNVPFSTNNNLYRVVVSGDNGNTTSLSARLTVIPLIPLITSQTFDGQVEENEDITFNVLAIGASPLQYQWQISTDPAPFDWNNLPGENGQELELTNVPDTFDGNFYRCIVTNPNGTAESIPMLLTVVS